MGKQVGLLEYEFIASGGNHASFVLFSILEQRLLWTRFAHRSQIGTRHTIKQHLPKMGVPGGTGEKLTRATIIVAGVASLVASLLSIV
jgi:hypothetical protein